MATKFIKVWLIATVIAVVVSMLGFRVTTFELLIVYGVWLILKAIGNKLRPKKEDNT